MLKHLALLFILAVWPAAALCADKVVLRIGATLPLTGGLAQAGEDIRRGLELGVSDSSSDRLGFELIFEDNQHDLKQAAAAAQKLLRQDHLDVIVSLWDMAEVVAPLADQARTPHLSIRWDPHVAEKHAYTFTVESTYLSYENSELALLKALGIKSAAIITEEAQGWILGSDYLTKIASASGITITGDEHISSQSRDAGPVILKLARKQPDIILIHSNPPLTELVIRKLREVAPHQRFTGFFEILDPPFVEGIPFTALFVAAPWFEQRFMERWHEPYRVRAPQAYDIIKMLASVQPQAKTKLSGTELVARLSGIHNLPGASGTLNVNATRNIEGECVWRIARDGKFETLSAAEAAKLYDNRPAPQQQK